MSLRPRPCGCNPEADELCTVGKKLAERACILIPPYGNDDAHSWETFHHALAVYERHLGACAGSAR